MMKSKYILIQFLAILFILIAGCKNDDQTRLQAGWSSKDPIAIPVNNRIHERSLGNLVSNPSFETGKIYYEESNIKSYDINGWKRVGEHIEWINAGDGENYSEEVYDGKHAIKIKRDNADETENMGEGILSDFIKVIPGNYDLKLFLKLENVCPNQARIGAKMFDAVNIRIQYFDKNKIRIDGTEYNAFNKNRIDNTFKALSLSNFWQINDFGWGEVYGKTAYSPFFDGDVPDQARYVKIFIGLKGTGTMWIDKVDFRYTRENFTLLERLKPYFDSSLLANDMVFPQVQKIENKYQINFYNADFDIYPVIVVPNSKSKTELEVAHLLKDELQAMFKNVESNNEDFIRVVDDSRIDDINENQFVISIGKNELYKQFNDQFPDSLIINKNDAYYIYSLNEGQKVFINGNSKESYLYVIKTIKQLFDVEKGIYYGANIIDYPDFQERACLIHYFDKDINLLSEKANLLNNYKCNQLYFEWYDNDNTNHYPFSSTTQLKTNYTNYGILVDLIKQNAKSTTGDNGLITYKSILSENPESILFIGDYIQEYKSCNSQQISFISSNTDNLAHEHRSLIRNLENKIGASKIEFLPPWNRLELINQGQGKAELYFHELCKNINASLYWTGGTYASKSIDYADFIRISDTYGTIPSLIDNSLLMQEYGLNSEYLRNYYAGKIRTLSIFGPENIQLFNDYTNYLKPKVIVNTGELSELNTISLLTSMDYYWNFKSYNPDKSLWIILNKLYGKKNAINLIYFSDAYYGLKEVCQKIQLNGVQYKNIRIAKNFENDLNKYFNELEKDLDNKDLLKEIEFLKSDILLKYSDLTINVN